MGARRLRHDLAELERIALTTAQKLLAELPSGLGFALILFTFAPGGAAYVGNGPRAEVIREMKKFIAEAEKN